MKSLRVGLIGAGKMGLNHLRAIGGCTGVTVVGVADPDARAEQMSGLIPDDCAIVTNAGTLFEQCQPDVVHIVTPPATHVDLASEALRHGVHVYIEKPVAERTADVEALLALANQHGRAICAGHQCLFDHAAIKGRAKLGELGKVVHVHSHFSFRQVRRSMNPIDQAKDILPHAIYMLLDYVKAARPDLVAVEPVVASVDCDAEGGAYGLLKVGDCRATFSVTLIGRPVEQYIHVSGTNGSMRVDLVRGSVVDLTGPGASLPSAVIDPYREAMKIVGGSTAGFVRHVRERRYGYPGLRALCQAFYDHIRAGAPAPMTPNAIIETVAVCGEVGRALETAHNLEEEAARQRLVTQERHLPPVDTARGTIAVTGAAGFLGRFVVSELRQKGWVVRGIGRQLPRLTMRVPGVDYLAVDLSRSLPAHALAGVTAIVHCAAETRGGKTDHERNSIAATRSVIDAATAAGTRRLVNISSVAVMTPPSGGRPMDESTAVDADSLGRGPYVWGKAQAERIAVDLCAQAGISLRTIRLGPLVDYDAFEPPGRLGRDLGPVFVAVGPKRRPMALLDVKMAAEVIEYYLRDFEAAPPLLNLLERRSPTRTELVGRLRSSRPGLRVFWIPMVVLRVLSPPLKLAQRLLLGAKEPLDIASAFSSPTYSSELATRAVARSRGFTASS